MNSGNCWNCGSVIEANNYGRQDECLKCGKDSHVCRNCIHHDTHYNNECKENQADRIVDKEKKNFCDYFSPQSGIGGGAPSKEDLLSAAEALFKKK
ncbi:MAG: hypothetical protein CL678_17165 [Bdellovibrionaceae bacterium]|nr:hypothetical protein [Pseudobdellovibrionaceae bacterium]